MRKITLAAAGLLLSACCAAPAAPWQSAMPTPENPRWQMIDFGFNSEPTATAQALVIPSSERVSGLSFNGDLDALLGQSRDHYEIALQARRTWGNDLFLGLTFPLGRQDAASLVLGGWGGGICGLSDADGQSANANPYKSIRNFENGRWYKVRLRVTPSQVQAWLDGEALFTVERAQVKHFSVRSEVEPTAPLGLFTFATSAEIKDVRARQLK